MDKGRTRNGGKRILLHCGMLHQRGGIETYIHQLAPWLRTLGFQVTILSQSSRFPPEVLADYQSCGVRVITLDLDEKRSVIRKMAGVSRILWRLRAEFDVIYSHGYGSVFLLHRMLPAKLWLHHHHLDISREFLSKWGRGYRTVIQSADCVICCTDSQMDTLRASEINPKNTAAIPCLKSEGSIAQPPILGAYILGFASVLKRVKGIDVLMAAARPLLGIHCELRFWGNPYEFDPSELAEANCRWMGEFQASDLDSIAGQINAFCLPSHFPEGFPLVVSEMMSRGVPIICSSSGGLRDLVDFHPLVEVLKVNSPDEIVRAVERLKERDTPAARQSLRQAYFLKYSNDAAKSKLRELLALD
jgi:glycosyltransferase involved in cell wall biosynthesis